MVQMIFLFAFLFLFVSTIKINYFLKDLNIHMSITIIDALNKNKCF